MSKDFDSWNKLKKAINQKDKNIFFNEREIWIAYLGLNVGVEENGKGESFCRPVLIFRKYNSKQFLAIPLSTKTKASFYSYELKNISFLKQESYLLISQARTLDSKRLYRRLGKLSKDKYKDIQTKSARIFIRASGA